MGVRAQVSEPQREIVFLQKRAAGSEKAEASAISHPCALRRWSRADLRPASSGRRACSSAALSSRAARWTRGRRRAHHIVRREPRPYGWDTRGLFVAVMLAYGVDERPASPIRRARGARVAVSVHHGRARRARAGAGTRGFVRGGIVVDGSGT